MTFSTEQKLRFINDNLEWSDNKIVAASLKSNDKKKTVDVTFVSRVRNGKATSRRVLDALYKRAQENYNTALKIAEYANKKVSL